MIFLTGLFGFTRALVIMAIVLLIGTVVVRPQWFGLASVSQTPVMVLDVESSETGFVDVINGQNVLFESPDESSGTIEVVEFDEILSNLDFTNTSLGMYECAVLGAEAVDEDGYPISASQFLTYAHQFVFGTYEYDGYSPTPIIWWVELLNPFCPDWDLQKMRGEYAHYDDTLGHASQHNPSLPPAEYRNLPLPEFVSIVQDRTQ